MKTSLTEDALAPIRSRLHEANQAFAQRYPGERNARQPVHTVYGGAHLFRAGTAPRLGELALGALAKCAPDAGTFARAIGLPEALAETVYARVQDKLRREPVEDFRVDFEDGYGVRADAEEDQHAVAAAGEMAKGLAAGTLPPFIGIRIKPLTAESQARALRTLDGFLTALLEATGGKLPPNYVVTLPKVQIPEQVAAMADALELLESRLGLAAGTLVFEIMIEQTQAILDATGRAALPALIEAARGRCIAAHLGTYDYTASCGIIAAHQRMDHPACDFAKHVMQVSLAGTGVWLSDGATNILPVGDVQSVHDAWKIHMRHTRRSLEAGFYQGWDLHPAQLPTRFAAVYGFFLEALPAASERLKNFVAKAAQATLVGDVFDDAATGQGLLNFFLRGLHCGAITEDEAQATGLTVAQIRSRSFFPSPFAR
ncbi:aldolase/citrate lyase family protein [Pendulispora rubella]|uniref:Aldolase/citrate lyase family protein n=1 Tax=Pendulispora rubella TaxID=2741070 RepID=A0ABZ2L6K8_9BACT